MRLLLDTHALLFWVYEPNRLGPVSEVIPTELLRNGFTLLPIDPKLKAYDVPVLW